MLFATADGHFILQCPRCGSFTMSERDGSWACRGCAGSVLVHVDRIVHRQGFRPQRQRSTVLAQRALVTT